jgi:Integrase zinc binding domain/Integrase core domain
VADTLSRPPPQSADTGVQQGTVAEVAAAAGVCEQLQPGLDYAAIAVRQLLCPETQQLLKSTSLQVKAVPVQGGQLYCDFSTGSARLLIPAADRRAVFSLIHNLAQPGIRATKQLLAKQVVWRVMATDTAKWCRDCQHCQSAKITTQAAAAVQAIPVPDRRFSHLHVDLVGPLPTSASGFRYMMTMIDRSTRWLEAVPLANVEAATCADGLIAGWISRFGVPSVMTTDRGTQFASALWSLRLGIEHRMTTAYHPQSNGLVERAHRQIKDALRARVAGTQWPEHLPWVLLGLRAAPKDDSNTSATEAMLGTLLMLPGQLITAEEPPVPEFVERLRRAVPLPTRPMPQELTDRVLPAALWTASFVYVRRGGAIPPLSPLYSGLYQVLSRSPKVFQILVGGEMETVSVDRLKPHLGSSAVSPPQPPRRGRPPLARPPAPTVQ